uniref:glucuronosyltransferase n=1 Tax=Meloidogyne hapla TaxID=6305 RepID=A0A1I8BAK8_MELHA
MHGSFAVFEALGIEKTFNVSNTVFFPEYLQFLDIDAMKYKIPSFIFAEPRRFKTDKMKRTIKEIKNDYKVTGDNPYNNLFKNEIENKEKSSLEDLFREIKYHFINQHPIGNFEGYPENDKIVYIGGFVVEKNETLLEKISEEKPECVVLLAFGTIHTTRISEIMGKHKNLSVMFQIFEKNPQCQYTVKLDKEFLPEKYDESIIHVTEEDIPQKDILGEYLRIKNFNRLEALYAGVPLICIPIAGDQFYNSSLVENLGIGKYVALLLRKDDGKEFPYLKFIKDFEDAFNKIMKNE